MYAVMVGGMEWVVNHHGIPGEYPSGMRTGTAAAVADEINKQMKGVFCMSEAGKKRIQDYMDSLKLNEPVSPEEFHQAVKSAYKDRSTQIYFIWKKLKELYPEVDANRVIREGSWDFGLWQGKKIAAKLGAENIGPVEAVLGQTSKGGVMTFEQELLELEDDRAVKLFRACPHAEALSDLGEGPETIKMFCRDMLGYCDYAICEPFPNVDIDFPTTVADGEGQGCAMTITRKKH